MKTRKCFNEILSVVLLTAIFSLSLACMAFASASTVTWKETVTGTDRTFTETYNSETGLFGRTLTNDTNGELYLCGVQIPQKIESGTVVVNVEFSNVSNAGDGSQIKLFTLSSEEKGWRSTAESGLAFRSGGTLREANGTKVVYSWNTDLASHNGTNYYIPASEGKYKLKYVASAEDKDSDWNVEIYDVQKSNDIPVFTCTIARDKLKDIKYIMNTNWGKGTATTYTVDKFKVKVFPVGYGNDFSAAYVSDPNDYTDRVATVNVSGTAISDIDAIDAYIVDEDNSGETKLDTSNISFENGVVQINVPTDVFGHISIKLVLKTEGGNFALDVPLTGNPFEDEYIGNLFLKAISPGVAGETVKVKPDFYEIVLNFNNYISPDTLGAVTFTGEGVDNLQMDFSDNGKTLTISFDPLIDKEFYTLTIGTGLGSINNKFLEEEITYTYQVDSDLTKLNITSHDTETDYILLPSEKMLEVEFNFNLDPATVTSGILFTKADGTAIPGGYNVEVGNSNNQAIITFGRLRQGEYKLVTTSLLKAQEDGIGTREAEWSFLVETDDDVPIVSSNFSNFEEGDISNTQLSNDNVSFGGSTYEIVTTEGGTKYVTSIGTQEAPGGNISITLPEPVTEGKIAFDLSFKAIGGSIKRNLFTAKNSSGNKVYMLQLNESNKISNNNESNTMNGEFTDVDYTTDEDGFYNLRVVYMAEDELSDWTVLVYDKLTSMTEPIWQGKVGRVYDSANGKYGLPDISQMVLFDIWWRTGNDNAGVAVKEYAYHVLPVPEVLSSNLGDAEPDIDEIELFVDSDLNVSQLSEETIMLTDGEREIPAVVDYNAQDRKLTIKPKEYLEYDTQYQIKFKNMICENESFTTPQRPVSVSSNPVLADADGVRSIQISTANNTGTPATICAIAKILDAEGNLIKIVGSDSLSLNDELPLAGVTWQAGYKVQTFIWASQNGLIYPISSPVELTD